MKIQALLNKSNGKANYTIKTDKGFNLNYELRKGQAEAIEAIDSNFMENIVFVAPTAYGKTIVAVHYIIGMYNAGLKTLYTAPLKALTAEMVSMLNDMGFIVLEDTGDYRKDPKKDYKKADIVITTNERLDSVMRNPKNHWVFNDFGLLIVDEIHNVHTRNRGTNLESLLVKIKHHTGLAIMAMSATVDNYDLIADFLNAKYIYVPPEERPVKQNIKVKYYYSEYQTASIQERNNMIRPLLHDLIRKDKQALVFCSSRNRCESLARDFSDLRLKDPVLMAKKSNYTWHHADLEIYQKKEIERMFRNNEVRFIFCTPTLAMGVNLPAYCVIIYDTCRWNGLISDWELIETIEVEQMIGRAGRPQFGEKECQVLILSRIADDPYTFEESIVESKLALELRAVLNEWITSDITDIEELKNCLLNKSLISLQMDKEELKNSGGKALGFLLENGFINKTDTNEFTPTFLGRITALFYIKPETSLHFKQVESEYRKEISDLELTAILLNTDEFLDMIRVNKKKDAEVVILCGREFNSMGVSAKIYDERILKAIPMIFTSYFNEKYKVRIIVYRSTVGKLSGIMNRLFSSAEVIIQDRDLKKRISQLKVMVKNRTLDRDIAILKSVRGIGGVRLKRLFDAGIKKPDHFFRRTDSDLMRIMKVTIKQLNNIKENLKLELKRNETI